MIRKLGPVAVPPITGTYFETFAGGGAFFWHLQPLHAVLSDNHHDLMMTYAVVKCVPTAVSLQLEELKAAHTADAYYWNRDEFNALRFSSLVEHDASLDDIRKAALFIYLIAKSFNGLCRYNSKGEFNAPIHKISHLTRYIPDAAHVNACSSLLQTTELRCADFREIIPRAMKGDFILADPPYVPVSAISFQAYSGGSFSAQDQTDLRDALKAAGERGAKFMAFNSDVPFTRELYKDFNVRGVEIASLIGCKKETRGHRNEIVITNY
jgi:DNA adenine methylase